MADDSKSGFWQTVPGIITAFAGIITAIGGLLLVLFQIGFFGGKPPQNNPTQVSPDRVNSSSSTNVSQTPQRNAAGSSTEQTEANQVDISGTWHDTYGVVYSLEQNGDHFKGQSYYQGIRSEGSGVLIGRAYESEYRSTRPSTGHCKGTVSSDGRSISIDCWDSAIGDFSTRMSRDP